MKLYFKLIPVSVCSILLIAALGVVYGFIAHRFFTLRYIFNANFLFAAVLMLVSIVIMFLPSVVFTKIGNVLDRFSYLERSFDNRESRQRKARVVLWLGLYNMIFAGLIQILLSLII